VCHTAFTDSKQRVVLAMTEFQIGSASVRTVLTRRTLFDGQWPFHSNLDASQSEKVQIKCIYSDALSIHFWRSCCYLFAIKPIIGRVFFCRLLEWIASLIYRCVDEINRESRFSNTFLLKQEVLFVLGHVCEL